MLDRAAAAAALGLPCGRTVPCKALLLLLLVWAGRGTVGLIGRSLLCGLRMSPSAAALGEPVCVRGACGSCSSTYDVTSAHVHAAGQIKLAYLLKVQSAKSAYALCDVNSSFYAKINSWCCMLQVPQPTRTGLTTAANHTCGNSSNSTAAACAEAGE